MKKPFSKDKFISIINSLQQVSDMLNELYGKYGIDLIDCNLDQSNNVIDLLEYIFDAEDAQDIGWWCWETDFGRDYPSCLIYENIDGKEISFLKSFSYRTRYSAREFCQSLIDYIPDFSKEKITEDIEDQSWMPLDWQNDPTISSMLTMLDAIHCMFCNTSGLWERLNSGCISFYFLSIENLGLTDDLYIKMNSRGKPLTEFEHFKAEWEGFVAKINDESDLSYELSRKIDTEWTDILWPYKGSNNIIDDEFVRYYSYL